MLSVKWGVGCTCRLPTAEVCRSTRSRSTGADIGYGQQGTKIKVKSSVTSVACCVLLYLSVFSAHDNGRGRAAYAPPLTPLLSLWLSLLITELGYLNFADDTSGE